MEERACINQCWLQPFDDMSAQVGKTFIDKKIVGKS